jgi:hypothetical protein
LRSPTTGATFDRRRHSLAEMSKNQEGICDWD